MIFSIEVTKWWAALGEDTAESSDRAGFDGREIVFEGRANIDLDIYYSAEETRFDGAICRIHLWPIDKDSSSATGTAHWWQDANSAWWIYLDINLARRLWEDLWNRTYYPRPPITIEVVMESANNLPKPAMAHADIKAITISN